MTTITVIAVVLCVGAIMTLIGRYLIERAHRPRGRFVESNGFRQHVIEMGTAAARRILSRSSFSMAQAPISRT